MATFKTPRKLKIQNRHFDLGIKLQFFHEIISCDSILAMQPGKARLIFDLAEDI